MNVPRGIEYPDNSSLRADAGTTDEEHADSQHTAAALRSL